MIRGRDIIEIAGQSIDPSFDINFNESITSLYKIIYEYLFVKNTKLSQDKGIMLCGIEGTGKTMAMEIIRSLILTYQEPERRFTIVKYEKIVEQYREINNEIFDIYGYGKLRDICFDDFLSMDNKQRSDFGERVNLADLLIKDRYSVYKEYKLLTHATTNQSPESLQSIMSPPAYDRMLEMFHFIRINGSSIRKSKATEVTNE